MTAVRISQEIQRTPRCASILLGYLLWLESFGGGLEGEIPREVAYVAVLLELCERWVQRKRFWTAVC